MDISTNANVPSFVMISHSFRLELFFLIAGFFSHMKFHSEGIQGFLKSRLVRIAIPFFIGWSLLRPMLVSGWTMGAESMRGEVNILNGLKTGFLSLADLPKDLFIGTHLWFLYYLLLISMAVLLIRYVVSLNKTAQRKLSQFADTTAHWICSSRLAIIVVAMPTAGCLWFMNNWGMDTPDKTLMPHIPVSLIFGGFFLFGWLLHRQTFLMERFARLTWDKFALCIITIVAANLLAGYQMKFTHPQYSLFKAGYIFSYAVMMWTLVSLTIGIFKRLLDRPSKIVRYFADSSYWLYLIHLPIVIWLQIAFAEISIHWSIKLFAISVLTIFLSTVLYELFVRSTFVGAVLNGKRKPRVLHYLKIKDKG